MKIRSARVAGAGCFCVFLACSSLLVSTGCKPSAEKLAAREALLNREIDALFNQAQELTAANQTGEALALVEKGLSNPKYQSQKARFFTQKIDLLLMTGQEKAARDLTLQAWKNTPALARPVFDRIFAHYQQRNSQADILSWCADLHALGADLPQDLRSQVLNRQLGAALALNQAEASKSTIDTILATVKPEEAADLLQKGLGSLIDSGNPAFAAALIRHVEANKPAAPLFSHMLVTLSMRCVLAAKEWDNVAPAFTACVEQLPDDQLLKLSRTVFSALQKNGRGALAEQSSKQVIFAATAKTNSVNFASRVWVECGVTADRKTLNERLEALLNANVSPVQVGNLFDRYFYEMVNDLDIVRGLCKVGERILAVCNDPATVNSVKVKILDGAFITDNFDLAVQMLEQGIPGKDKAWHDMSLPKVKAHRAMAQNKPREAVQYFREFMNTWIASDQKEEFDPTSGIAYSREWILGRNANRIAGILDSIPDKAEADKARAEAKEYFKIALKKAENDAEAIKLLKEETKNMGL